MSSTKHRILIVDDEEDVHAITRLSLRGLRYRERRLEFISVTTGREAVEVMRRQPGIAVILLDVVMESEHAGLEACRVIRSELANPFVRILLRTGQPGAAPEKKVIEEYDIDGYLAKGELTSMRLYTAVRTSLKAHGELMDLEALVADRTREIQRQKAENERLLLSILPPAIAERVRRGELRGRFEERQRDLGGPVSFESGALAVYMPMDRRHALAAGADLPEHAEGSVLFADVKGFTPLTETLTQEMGSRRGAEELTSQLDRVYGALIGEVHRYRGSVIGFSGDAITCWFEGDDGRRAVACALNMQRVMGWFAAIETPSGSILPVAVKAAVTCGPVRRLQVGNPQIQVMDVLAGATLDRLTFAEALAHQGEVVVGPEVISALGDKLRLAARSLGQAGERYGVIAGLTQRVEENPWPPLPGATEEARKWLLPSIRERLESGQGQYLAELRPAVALFLAFDGLDYDTDEGVGEKLDSWIFWVQETLGRFGGSLLQLTTGDKGSYLYAVFGAPVAYEDATERALAASLTLRSPPSEFSFLTAVRIGLSQGRMRAGEYGSETRRTYGVLSDETNLAARLMSKAQAGQILAGGRIATTATRTKFKDLGTIPVRGKREQQPVFEVLGWRQTPFKEKPEAPEIIGRREERRLLRGKLEILCREKVGGLAVLEGEAGIGKSRLVLDILAQAGELNDLRVLYGAGQALELATPFAIWRTILRQLPEGEELLTAAEEEAESVADRWVESLRQAADEQPLLVVLENAQWLDSKSWRLIKQIRYEVKSLLILMALRPLRSSRHPLPQDPDVLRLELSALPREQGLDLARQCLGVEKLPQEVASLLLEKAQGHPLFTKEFANAMVEQGVIRVEEGACAVLKDPTSLTIPESIERVVTSTLDAVQPFEQLALKVASVIGGVFSFELLHAMYPMPMTKEELAEALGTLERLRLILQESPEPDLSYSFRQRTTQDVAYDLLLYTQRRHLHRAAAEWYENRHAGGLAPYYPLLAFHWWKALQEVELAEPRLVTKAIDCLAEAGEQALRGGAHGAAVDHVRRGLGLLESLPRSVERSHLELELRLALDTGLCETLGRGAPEVKQNAERVVELRELVEQSGHIPIRFVEESAGRG